MVFSMPPWGAERTSGIFPGVTSMKLSAGTMGEPIIVKINIRIFMDIRLSERSLQVFDRFVN